MQFYDSQHSLVRKCAVFVLLMLGLSSISNADCCQPRNCQEWKDRGFSANGVYVIQPLQMSCSQVSVYCDMTTNGGGWTVFQRRLDGSVDFYRSWWMYERGFGNVSGEYWLGLSYMHALTAMSPQELRVDMSDFEGNDTYARYSQFSIADDLTGYQLTISGYSGVAGDCISGRNGMPFSTWDRDQDTASSNCASSYHGAWWYTKCHCTNPNGHYHAGVHSTYAEGVNWNLFRGYYYSLKSIEFKIRPL